MSKNLVYIVGNGGRESALKFVLKDHYIEQFIDKGSVLKAVKAKRPDLVVIGPEQPLVEGLSDELRALKVPVFGPSKKAAQLEGSKAFTENFLNRHNIARPHSKTISISDLKSYQLPNDIESIVLKADGLAGGKGVVLPKTKNEAKQVLSDMLSGQMFGSAGEKVVIQERLQGPELSVFVVSDGTNYTVLPYTQDHKRLKNNDKGLNTGGMGAYTPVPKIICNDNQSKQIDRIVKQSIDGMRNDGCEFRGVLFIGLILAIERNNDPVVIEYNVRFGDPEAEVLLPYISDKLDVFNLLKSTDQNLVKITKVENKQHFITVCLAAAGYPVKPIIDQKIYGLEKQYKNVNIFLAAVTKKGHGSYTSGGRVLYVTGYGSDINEAAKNAYGAIGKGGVHFKGMQYRTDIGWQARSKDMLK